MPDSKTPQCSERNTEAKPRTSKPIQNTIVFSPSNMLDHRNTITETILIDRTFFLKFLMQVDIE